MIYKPKKKYGQHFLHDQSILNEIIIAADLKENDIVWEVGAGLGALTDHLLKRKIFLTIYEIDDELVPILEKKYLNFTNLNYLESNSCLLHSLLKIVHKDILKLDWEKEIKMLTSLENLEWFYNKNGAEDVCQDHSDKQPRKIKIVTNLPYQISSPFLYKITENNKSFDTIVMMLQKEVAKRVCAKPGNKDFGVLSLKTQFYFETHYLFEVSSDKFTPPPKVHSAVIKLVPKKDIPILQNELFFWDVIEKSFRMKRKTLRNNLIGFLPRALTHIFDTCPPKIDLNRRGETLNETEFIDLYEYLLQFIDS